MVRKKRLITAEVVDLVMNIKKKIKLFAVIIMLVSLLVACDDGECGMCNGSGYFQKKTCPVCNGSGNSDFDPYDVYDDMYD